MPHEVITLQFGGFANFAGAHYWNIQDEICGYQDGDGEMAAAANQISNKALYRELYSQHGDATYYPRLVAFDAKGSLGSLSTQTLSADAAAAAAPPAHLAAHTWAGRSEVHRSAPVEKPRFQHELDTEYQEGYGGGELATSSTNQPAEAQTPLETAARALDIPGAVQYFTDFLKVPLHPRTVQIVEGLWRGGPELQAWGQPEGGLHGREEREEALERMRALAEESDALAGFQCFVEDLSVWGSFSGDILQELRDDYGSSKAVLIFSLRPTFMQTAEQEPAAELRRRRLCEALSTATLSQHADLFVLVSAPSKPSALPLLRWRPGDLFHESALCGAALSAATLPYRLISSGLEGSNGSTGAVDMWSLANLLTSQHGTPLSALSMAMPCRELPSNAQQEASEADERMSHTHESERGVDNDGRDTIKSGLLATYEMSGAGVGGAGDKERFAECIVLQGARSHGATTHLSTASSSLDAALASERVRCVRHRVLSSMPLPIPLPFPGIFSPSVTHWGDVEQRGSSINHIAHHGHHVASCPLLVRLAGTAAFTGEVRRAGQQFTSIASTAHGAAMLDGWGVDRDRREEVSERLAWLSNSYAPEEL